MSRPLYTADELRQYFNDGPYYVEGTSIRNAQGKRWPFGTGEQATRTAASWNELYAAYVMVAP